MTYTSRVTWETLRSINSSTLTGFYQAVGTPLLYGAYIIKMVNNSNVLVTVSIDGINDVDVLPAGSYWTYGEGTTDRQERVPQGTQIYVKGAAGAGLIYLVVQYLVQG